MNLVKLQHAAGAAKSRPLRTAPRLSSAAIRLLDGLALQLDPSEVPALLEQDPDLDLLIGFSEADLAQEAETGLAVNGYRLADRIRLLPVEGGGPVRVWFLSGFPERLILAAASRSGLPWLVRSGHCREELLYARVALLRGLRFQPAIDGFKALGRAPKPHAVSALTAARFEAPDGRSVMVVAPRLDTLLEVTRTLETATTTDDVLITTPRSLEAALRRGLATDVLRNAVGKIERIEPQLSAKSCPTAREAGLIIGLMTTLPLSIVHAPGLLVTSLLIVTSLAFVALSWMRYKAVTFSPVLTCTPLLEDADLPTYSVLVAVHDEADMAGELVSHLARLDYPVERLEILFLIEEHDEATCVAFNRACERLPHARVIDVPAGLPRTKPRALAYGLAFARGDIVTVYDAEDRPEPGQLRTAAAALIGGPDELACVQARLRIDHVLTPLQAQFAIEYAALFDGLLPWLGSRGAPLPLGGTSNHFKRHALLASHGWDPYNVTEDADLGIRLMRYGFRTDVIDSTTLEAGPSRWLAWHRQRVRWQKGWIITWLVHSRRPAELFREIGRKNALLFHVQCAATVLAPLCHPVGLLLPVLYLAGWVPPPIGDSPVDDIAAASAALSLVCGYMTAIMLARSALRRTGRKRLLRFTWLMPAYWLLSSLAAWGAIIDLLVHPHYWAKTPHTPTSSMQKRPPAARPTGLASIWSRSRTSS